MDQAQGNGAPGASQGQGAPGALTEERVSQMVAETVNAAVTGRLKTFKKDLLEEFGKGLEPLSKKLEEFATQVQQQPQGKSGKKKDGEPEEATPEYRGLQKRLQDQEVAFNKLQGELTTERAKAADAAMRSALRDKLAVHGIDGVRAKHAIASLVDSERRVRRDDDGQAVFMDTDGQPIDLDTGLKAWAKTEDAKIFLPPTGARGSGGSPGSGPPKGQQQNGEVSATDLGLAIAREFGGVPIGT